MPKFGLKCFLGSFLLSLVAVFAATKAYVVLSVRDRQAENRPAVSVPQPRNIELFAANEETDPLYEKFQQLGQNSNDDMGGLRISEKEESVANAVLSTDLDDVIYKEETQIADAASKISADDALEIADASELIETTEDEIVLQTAAVDNEEEEKLLIADAAIEPSPLIPLIHHFKTDAGTVTVSDTAENNQIALASHDVSIENLGTEKKAAVTEEIIGGVGDSTVEIETPVYNDPWEVAETANKHVSKNTINSYTFEHSSSVTAMDKSGVSEVAENGQVPYKMQKNLLVPIPEDIMNETDMTPQLSTSAENKKIEADLRAKNELPSSKSSSASNSSSENFAMASDDEKDVDDTTSRSLTESIAAWFSGNKDKSSKSKPEKRSGSQSNKDQSNSIFQKLLGIGSDNVTPTELKLSFQPNRAEISGQTLEWLHAFSDNAIKYENVLIEIRISETAPYDLQQKRLKLLYRILANNGVEYNKVNIIFTDREPNSFIIRNVRYATEEEQQKALAAKAYSPWY